MPFSFPASPSIGQTSAQNGRTYVWTGVWELVANVTTHAASHTANGADPLTLTSAQISDFATAAAAAAPATTFHPFLLMGG